MMCGGCSFSFSLVTIQQTAGHWLKVKALTACCEAHTEQLHVVPHYMFAEGSLVNSRNSKTFMLSFIRRG